jgi:release factor glutamine methyltransferase
MTAGLGDAIGGDTIGAAVAEAAARLAAAGIVEARREARLLAALALGVDPAVAWGFPERRLDESPRQRLAALVARRAAREPLSRLRGTREFWSLDFALSPDTLDPRPDSETLIEAALALLPDREAPLSVVDFGTGSGCLLLALLAEFRNALGVGVDIRPGAAAVARRNAETLGLGARARFVVGVWDATILGPADVILANPPYIPSKEIETLAPEVARFEPRQALDGGPDGLAAYRVLVPASRRLLSPGGVALFEVGAGQAEAVARLAARYGLRVRAVRCDLAGIERCVAVGHP